MTLVGGNYLKNIFTIDVEDWFQTLDFNIPVEKWCNYEDRVRIGTYALLNALSKYNIKATFFILGYIAQKHPDMVIDILSAGHEIGSHGMYHKMVTTQTPEEFKNDLAVSRKVIEEITGTPVILYRSSSWSINNNNPWALEILEDAGYKYDSSMQPFRTPLSGSKGIPTQPFTPVINGRRLNLIEIPSSVIRIFNANFPFSGGFYLRAVHWILFSKALTFINQHRPGMVYVHPWEFDHNQPRLKVHLHRRFIHYYNIKNNLSKLEKIISHYEFDTMSNVMKDVKTKLYKMSYKKMDGAMYENYK